MADVRASRPIPGAKCSPCIWNTVSEGERGTARDWRSWQGKTAPGLADQGKALFSSKDDGSHHQGLSRKRGGLLCTTCTLFVPVKQSVNEDKKGRKRQRQES